MDRVRKTYFDPLATTKDQIRAMLRDLPVGSAHPFSPERVLLCRTENGIDEIDISAYPEDYFFNAVDLGEMGEVLLHRMSGFQTHLSVFSDFQIMQAPAATFKLPIVSGQITILAVSTRQPTYYDFCFADESCNACCWLARYTFRGMFHSGDLLNGQDLLDYVRIDKDTLTDKPICVFISGYQCTQITRFLGTNPALLVADHEAKILYIVPVPLDAATIGDATICCPLVIKRDGDSLICSILSKATTDREMMCCGPKLVSKAFPEAIKRADFNISAAPAVTATQELQEGVGKQGLISNSEDEKSVLAKKHAVIATHGVSVPSFIDVDKLQQIRFGTGLDFQMPTATFPADADRSEVVLPCIFGSALEGPVLLATGTVPTSVPFATGPALLEYYRQLESAVVIVDERMTDNARNLATPYRINALFIMQLKQRHVPRNSDGVVTLMDSANINAVTALAGPQSLIVVQIVDKFYFYRGMADPAKLNTTGLAFGSDITPVIKSAGTSSILDPRAKRVLNLDEPNAIILPSSGHSVQPGDLEKLFESLPVEEIEKMNNDIAAAVPQLQALMSQKDLQALSKSLVQSLSTKVSTVVSPLRAAYVKFLTQEHKDGDAESLKKKNAMLGQLRKTTKDIQRVLEPVISSFSAMMSTQATSRRTHDLKRLVRQTQIQGNVEAVKTMTFETLAGYLETHAADMGVMLLNIETVPYLQLLGNLKAAIDASPACDLDNRVLHLEGFDAGIIIEQSQTHHAGPLRSASGPSHPTLALPYLNQSKGSTGSMLAWVCWDEFVHLSTPFFVRWMEKCNEPHIAAMRIILRDTLSNAVSSREHNLQPGSAETGHLMASLLMAAMAKLAARRASPPEPSAQPSDVTTALMRGLFGNLLTTAGSGVRPLSMVWQLLGTNPQWDIPSSDADWAWYDAVVALYPYTAWPLPELRANLERLLDKVVVRAVTKAENVAELRVSRAGEMARYCRLRNIQLDHSRTVITVFMRMLTGPSCADDMQPIATRLLDRVPHKLERQTASYAAMIAYLRHLSSGGPRRPADDLVAARVYTKRSAAFAPHKNAVATAIQNSDWPAMRAAIHPLLDEQARVAEVWGLARPELLAVQNIGAYRDLLEAEFAADAEEGVVALELELTRQVLGDAERGRVAWQVGGKGQFGADIEPLDEVFVREVLTGETAEDVAAGEVEAALEEVEKAERAAVAADDLTVQRRARRVEDEFLDFKEGVQPGFIVAMRKEGMTVGDVCSVLKIPVATMGVFAKALSPGFDMEEELVGKFRLVVLGLLKERSNREGSRPTRKLFGMDGASGRKMIDQ